VLWLVVVFQNFKPGHVQCEGKRCPCEFVDANGDVDEDADENVLTACSRTSWFRRRKKAVVLWLVVI
jgi:hypothetical protein